MSETIRVVRETVGNVQVSLVEPLGIERMRILGELRSSYLPQMRGHAPCGQPLRGREEQHVGDGMGQAGGRTPQRTRSGMAHLTMGPRSGGGRGGTAADFR